jgi:hypothetical protein
VRAFLRTQVLHLADGSSVRFAPATPLELPVADWLRAANVSLDAYNEEIDPDESGRSAPLRSTGVHVEVKIAYSNRDRSSGRAVVGARAVHADVSLSREPATWTGAGKTSVWVQRATSPRSLPSDYHLVERWRYGVLFSFRVSGKVFRLDVWIVLEVS